MLLKYSFEEVTLPSYVDVASPEWTKNSKIEILRKCAAVQIFGNDSNKSKFDMCRN
jgi:hypothetical protein